MAFQTLEMRTGLAESPENLELLEIIFSALLVGGIDRSESSDPKIMEDLKTKINVFKQAKSHFKSTFQDNIFVNEYDIFYQIISQYENTRFTTDELVRVLYQNKSVLLKSKYIYNYIETKRAIRDSGNNLSDDDFFELVMVPELKERYIELSHRVVDLAEYLTACDRYIEIFKQKYLLETAENMSAIVQGDDGARLVMGNSMRTLRTPNDCMDYYLDRIKVIHKLEAERGVQSFAYDGSYLIENKNRKKGEAILDYGIAELDAVKSKMRRGNMVCVMGPPKGGKTTFTTYLVERALHKGLNVAIWPLEGTPEEWIALITSAAIALGHIEQQDAVEISKTDILYENYKSEDDSQRVSAAQYTIAAGERRGRLSFLTGVAYVENFEDELTSHYENVNRFDVIVMDSPINMQSMSRMGKTEYLSKAFMNFKNYVANKMKVPALCLVTAQYKQDVIDFIRKNPNAEIDVTAGGETAESIRTPDDVIGLFSNALERENRMMRVHDIASRSNGHFESFYMGCALGCAKFWSAPELNE